ncbi:hypothetical protein MPPM_1994 [Methylorubrum populi]|uniref:Uncharacterized protein n=1 Tax=Methylorubrum populi TaxID=223967 RepID=A0A160PCD6_9HYPH|nr:MULTISPECIES: hypothetical protein [Methylobacteriaceae]MDQ0520112.1 hypothetical protein [Methylobacterium gregans]BAU90599.1 hypothetical protein MPPM_1994 [Methylorubrum populi]GLS52516.1 hypothetical protein GCM10007886_06990 [Methylobacterium gregans]
MRASGGSPARAEATRPTAQTFVSQAARTGNGGPPILSAVAEVRPIGELLYGRRFTRELAEDLGKDPRQLRRWLSGEAAVPERAVRWAREAARRRAREILALVGAEA